VALLLRCKRSAASFRRHSSRCRRRLRPSSQRKRIVGRPHPRRARAMRRMLSNCVPATTCSHSARDPLTLTHTGSSHSCNANMSAPRADPVANASAYRLGRTQNPMPARVMKKTGRNHRLRCCQSRCCNPGRPSGHDLAAKPDDPRRHAPCDPPTGRAPARALRALKPSRHPTLRTTTDTSCGRG